MCSTYVPMLDAPTPSGMSPRHSAILTRLTELGLALAERIQAEAMAASGVEDLDTLSQAFHRVSRSVRMSMALEAKLARAEREEARARAADPERRPPPIRAIERVLVWPEGQGPNQPKARRLREAEDEDLSSEWEEDEAAEPTRRKAAAAEAEAFAARVAFVHAELAAEFGPAYADAYAAERVAEAMHEEAVRRGAVHHRADSS